MLNSSSNNNHKWNKTYTGMPTTTDQKPDNWLKKERKIRDQLQDIAREMNEMSCDLILMLRLAEASFAINP